MECTLCFCDAIIIFYVGFFLGRVGQTVLAESKSNPDCELRSYVGGTPGA